MAGMVKLLQSTSPLVSCAYGKLIALSGVPSTQTRNLEKQETSESSACHPTAWRPAQC